MSERSEAAGSGMIAQAAQASQRQFDAGKIRDCGFDTSCAQLETPQDQSIDEVFDSVQRPEARHPVISSPVAGEEVP